MTLEICIKLLLLTPTYNSFVHIFFFVVTEDQTFSLYSQTVDLRVKPSTRRCQQGFSPVSPSMVHNIPMELDQLLLSHHTPSCFGLVCSGWCFFLSGQSVENLSTHLAVFLNEICTHRSLNQHSPLQYSPHFAVYHKCWPLSYLGY